MERVQFQEEQMLPELKAFLNEDVFNQKEIKSILLQRRQYESALVRRISRKSDYLRYIQYEMSLEKLRKARVKRLQLPIGKNSVTEFSLVRRQFSLFERALKRPKLAADVGLWVQYIKLAQKEGAKILVGRITARALSLHPRNPSLYILTASHALESQHSPSAARSLLQRGLRLNKDSIELWKAYIGMEIGFIVTTGRRWGVLGISSDTGKGKQKQFDLEGGVEDGGGGGGDDMAMETEVDDTEEARKEILNGSIVKNVIAAAVEAIPEPHILKELIDLVKTYPAPIELRHSLTLVLYSHLRDLDTSRMNSERKAMALKLLVAQHFGEMILSVDALFESPPFDTMPPKALLDAITQAIQTFHHVLRQSPTDLQCANVYCQFVLLFCGNSGIDMSLKHYLVKGLHKCVQESLESPTPWLGAGVGALMAGHVKAVQVVKEHAEALKLSCRYSKTVSKERFSADGCALVWLARLELESSAPKELDIVVEYDIIETGKEARKCVGVSGDPDLIQKIWLWGLDGSNGFDLIEGLIRESKESSCRDSHPNVVHLGLIEHYVRVAIRKGVFDGAWLQKKLKQQWGIGDVVWSHVFRIATSVDLHMDVIAQVYECWSEVISDDREDSIVEVVLGYAEYLLEKGKGIQAGEVVVKDGLGRIHEPSARAAIQQGWTRLLERCSGTEEDQVDSMEV